MKNWEEIYLQSPIHKKAKSLLWSKRFLIIRAEMFCDNRSSLLNETILIAAIQQYREERKEFEKMMNKFPRSYRRKLYRKYKFIIV